MLSIDIDTLQVHERTWYEPSMAVDPDLAAQLESLPPEAQVSRVRDEIAASVRRRLMSDSPLGVLCSGGLDSSLISAIAVGDKPDLHAFNAAIVDQPEVDEGPWAEAVTAALGIELHTAPITASCWRAGLVDATCHNERALVHESSVAMASIARLAHEAGVKVLLSGEGADELFGGYGWLHAEEYRDWAARGRRLEAGARGVYRQLQRRGWRAPAHLRAEQPPGESARAREIADRARSAYRHHRGARARLEAALLTDLGAYLPHLLNRQDKNTMQHSIETRAPFLDPALVSVAVNLPLETRVEPERKAVLRSVARGLLPDEVVKRSKVGFGFDIDRYLRPALRPAFLEQGVLRELLRVPAGAWGASLERLSGQPLLLHVTGEIWCRALLGGQARASIDSELWAGGP
jgi:asparagine synthase (glutamine-hydrolysing)